MHTLEGGLFMGLFKKDRKNDVKVSISRPNDSELKAILKQQSHVPKKRTKISDKRSENNERWQAENEGYIESLKKGELGFARNHLFNMASIREHEGDLIPALSLYFNVCYWDLSGFSSLEAYQLALRDSFKFIKPRPFLAPGVIHRISIVRKKLGLSDTELKEKFMSEDLSDSVPVHLFSQAECADLVIKSLSDGVDSIEKRLNTSIRNFIKSHK